MFAEFLANSSIAQNVYSAYELEILFWEYGNSEVNDGFSFRLPSGPRYEQLGELVVRRPTKTMKYEVVEVKYPLEHEDAYEALLELAREAGGMLPASQLKWLGVDGDVSSELKWFAWVLNRIMKVRFPKLISEEFWEGKSKSDGYKYILLKKPFTAFKLAIEEVGVDVLDAEIQKEKIRGQISRGMTKITRKERSQMLWDLLEKQPELTARDAAKIIGCSPSTITSLPAWKKKMGDVRKNNPKKPRMIQAGDPTAYQDGSRDRDYELKKLIAEQERDREASPIDYYGYNPVQHAND